MAFLKVGEIVKPNRRLYLLEVEMPSGMKCVKIGVASGTSSVERMMQVNRDIFMKYRYTAKIGIKRDREVPADLVFKYETCLHNFFKRCQYTPKIKFDGSGELFAIPLRDAVMAYEEVIQGNTPEFKYELPEPEIENIPDWIE